VGPADQEVLDHINIKVEPIMMAITRYSAQCGS
jgi:hypothetical protein